MLCTCCCVDFRLEMIGWCTHHLFTKFVRLELSRNCLTYSTKGEPYSHMALNSILGFLTSGSQCSCF